MRSKLDMVNWFKNDVKTQRLDAMEQGIDQDAEGHVKKWNWFLIIFMVMVCVVFLCGIGGLVYCWMAIEDIPTTEKFSTKDPSTIGTTQATITTPSSVFTTEPSRPNILTNENISNTNREVDNTRLSGNEFESTTTVQPTITITTGTPVEPDEDWRQKIVNRPPRYRPRVP